VVVGANDGKLHIFNANTLKELYAYVPNLVYPKLRFVTAPNYGRPTNPHQYLLDGPLTVSDVYDEDEKKWRTIIVGTMGGGGRGVFAVDVSSDTTPEVLFEISEADFPELGYVLGKPIIAPLKNGRWGVIFGNGSDSGDSNRSVATQSHLFVVDIFDAKNKTKVISTGAGRGLSAPAVLPDVNGVATAAYAGDLNGNMWKFDLSDMSIDSEELSEKVKKIFHATTSDSKEQPITAAPTLGINSASGGKVIVYFGTGKYFEANDQSVLAGDPHHSFYAVNDKGSTVDRSRLAQKTLDSKTRIITGTAILWETSSTKDTTDAYDGWFMDFGAGERVITKSLLIADKLVFPTVVPDASQCAYGGHSWIVEVPAVGNKFVNYKVLKDPPKQHELTTAAIGFGVTETAAAILLGDTQGTPDDLAAEEAPKSTGRQSWRELD
jgi:type IV pilus assembly protein PilY1